MALSNIAIFGILTITSLMVTFIFGILMKKNGKFFNYHKIFAWITAALAAIHAGLYFTSYY